MVEVSLVTCTYNRHHFHQNLKAIIRAQDYPHEKMEWIILDDTLDHKCTEFPESLDGIEVRYYSLNQKISLAKKRTLLNYLARGTYIVNIDDDDYYPPCRVSHAVQTLKSSGTPLVGSTNMYMYFTKDQKVYKFGPYRDNHGTAATLAYTKEYTRTHDFGDGNYAEEPVFTCQWSTPLTQLDPMKTVLALSHSNNTVEKTMFTDVKYNHVGHTVNPTDLKLEDFIADSEILQFYKSLQYEYKTNEYTGKILETMEQSSRDAQLKYKNHSVQRLVNELTSIRNSYEKYMYFVKDKNIGQIRVTIS